MFSDKNIQNDNSNKSRENKEKIPTYGIKEGLKRINTDSENLGDYANKMKKISNIASEQTKDIGKAKKISDHFIPENTRNLSLVTDNSQNISDTNSILDEQPVSAATFGGAKSAILKWAQDRKRRLSSLEAESPKKPYLGSGQGKIQEIMQEQHETASSRYLSRPGIVSELRCQFEDLEKNSNKECNDALLRTIKVFDEDLILPLINSINRAEKFGAMCEEAGNKYIEYLSSLNSSMQGNIDNLSLKLARNEEIMDKTVDNNNTLEKQKMEEIKEAFRSLKIRLNDLQTKQERQVKEVEQIRTSIVKQKSTLEHLEFNFDQYFNRHKDLIIAHIKDLGIINSKNQNFETLTSEALLKSFSGLEKAEGEDTKISKELQQQTNQPSSKDVDRGSDLEIEEGEWFSLDDDNRTKLDPDKSSKSFMSSGDLSILGSHNKEQKDRDWLRLPDTQEYLQRSQQQLRKYQEGSVHLPYEAIETIVKDFKQEADMVGESCQKYCQKSFAPGDIIINDLDKEYESSKKSYEGLLIDFENKKTFSEDTLINHIIKHQRMLSLLAEVTISTECQRQTRLDKELFGEVLPNFVTRIKDIVYPDNSQKERYIQKYQKWLQKYHNRIKEASDSHMDLLGKMGEADKSIKEIDKLSNLLLKKVSDTKKGITNVGYLLQRSDSRSGAEETSTLYKTNEQHLQDYLKTVQDYNLLRGKAHLSDEDMLVSLGKLSELINTTEKLYDDYSQLATKLSSKGKGHAIHEGEVSNLIDDEQRQAQLIQDEKLARTLQYEDDYTASMDLMNVDDDKVLKERDEHDAAEDKDNQSFYILQKFKTKSTEVVKYLKNICDQALNYIETENVEINTNIEGLFRNIAHLSSKEETAKIIENIEDYHQEIIALVEVALLKVRPQTKDKQRLADDLQRFLAQIEHSPEQEPLEGWSPEANQAKKRMREIMNGIAKSYGDDINGLYWFNRWSTLAVAYMEVPQQQKPIALVSINEGSLKNKRVIQKVRGQIGENEGEQWANQGETDTKRHAEKVLLDLAKSKKYKILGLTASRKFCMDCQSHLYQAIEPRALINQSYFSDQVMAALQVNISNPQQDQSNPELHPEQVPSYIQKIETLSKEIKQLANELKAGIRSKSEAALNTRGEYDERVSTSPYDVKISENAMKIISNNEYSPYLVRVSNSEFSDINTSNQDKKVIPKDNTEDISVDYKKLNAYTRQLMNIRNHASKEVNNAITTESHNKAKVYKNIVNSINILLEKNNHDPYPHGHKPDWIDDIDIKTITDTYANNILINLIKNMENINYKRINKQIKETYKAYAQNIVEWMKN